jgi:hypothetical protein
MANNNRIEVSKIQRLQSTEKKFGIDDINIFAYMPDSDELIVYGEIYAKKLHNSFIMMCSVYDVEGDIIASEENSSYSSGLVTSYIDPRCCNGIFPFKICVDIPSGNKVDKIRVYPRN